MGQAASSTRDRGPGVEKHRIQRCRAADEQAVQFWTTEADIGDRLWNEDSAEKRAIARVATHAVAGRQPEVAVQIDAEAVEYADRTDREHLAARQRLAVGRHLELSHVVRTVRSVRYTGVGDVEQRLVGRKCEAV